MYQPFPCYPSFSSFFVNQCHRSVTWNLFKKPFFPAIQLLDETFARDKTPFGVPLLFLMHLCIRLVKVFHVWLVQNCPIYNTNRFVLQILGKVVKRNNSSGSYIFKWCLVQISLLPFKKVPFFKRASWASSLIYALFYEGALF